MIVHRLLIGVLLLTTGGSVHAQGTWDAILIVDPYPTPYYSDWDSNPNIASLTLINSTAESHNVRIHFTVINHTNRVVVSGTSAPEPIAAGATVIFDNPYDVAGSTTHDSEMEDIAARTGRMPEGDYTACTTATDASGFVLAEACAPFSIVYPDPPLLVSPMDGDVLEQGDPLFTWTPVQVPINYQLSYVVRLVEVQSHQSAAAALRENIPHFESVENAGTSLRYPIDAQPLESGRTYAWSVQVLDQNGYAASANEGRSEIWTFAHDDGSPSPSSTPTSSNVTFTIRNAGSDVARFNEMFDDTTTTGWPSICPTWTGSVLNVIEFPILAEYVFPQNVTVNGMLVRDTTPEGDRKWAVTGTAGTSSIMLGGSCAARATIPRWVAIRTAADAQELDEWLLSGDSVQDSDMPGPRLEFAVAILSFFEETIGDDEPEMVRAFLEGHEVDLKTGLNVYGILDMRQFPALWDNLLTHIYDDDEHEAELLGFVGLNQQLALRFGASTSGATGVDVSSTREWLSLWGALPTKNIDGSAIKSVQLGLEVSYGDSIARRIAGSLGGTGRSYDLLLKPTVNVVTANDITWTGTIEFDFGMDWHRWVQPFSGDNKGTLRLKTDHEFQPGPLEGTAFALGHPEMVLDINEGLLNAIRSRSAGQIDWDFNLRGSLLLQSQEVATVGLTVGRSADKPKEFWEKQVVRSQNQLDHDIALLRELRRSETEARERGDTMSANAARRRYVEHQQVVDAGRKQIHRDSVILEGYNKRYAQGNRTPVIRSEERGRYFWQASLALGNMGLPELLDLLLRIPEALRKEDP